MRAFLCSSSSSRENERNERHGKNYREANTERETKRNEGEERGQFLKGGRSAERRRSKKGSRRSRPRAISIVDDVDDCLKKNPPRQPEGRNKSGGVKAAARKRAGCWQLRRANFSARARLFFRGGTRRHAPPGQ